MPKPTSASSPTVVVSWPYSSISISVPLWTIFKLLYSNSVLLISGEISTNTLTELWVLAILTIVVDPTPDPIVTLSVSIIEGPIAVVPTPSKLSSRLYEIAAIW